MDEVAEAAERGRGGGSRRSGAGPTADETAANDAEAAQNNLGTVARNRKQRWTPLWTSATRGSAAVRSLRRNCT